MTPIEWAVERNSGGSGRKACDGLNFLLEQFAGSSSIDVE